MSDAEWLFVAPYLSLISERATQRKYPLREIFNGLRYILKSGCTWRMMPNDLPPWEMVYQQTRRWQEHGVFEEINRDMRDLLRHLQGKDYPPTAMIIDSRTMQSTPESGGRAGYDAGKKKKGSKTHVAVDMYGNLLALLVTPANQADRDVAYDLAVQVQQATGESVKVCFADGAYSGQATADNLAACGLELVVVKRTDGQAGFKVLPKRWIVERTLGWLSRFKRFARDYERLPEALAHLQLVAFVMLLMPKLFARIAEVHVLMGAVGS